MNWPAAPESWSFVLRGYLPRLALFSLGWETLHLPLYTLWAEGRPGAIARALLHCTAGDVAIGTGALLLALVLNRAGTPAAWPLRRIGAVTALLAVAYTVLSERLNLALGNWAYSAAMPVVAGVEVGLSPLLQWVVVPLAAIALAGRQAPTPRR